MHVWRCRRVVDDANPRLRTFHVRCVCVRAHCLSTESTPTRQHIQYRVGYGIVQNIVELTKYYSSSARTTIKFVFVCGWMDVWVCVCAPTTSESFREKKKHLLLLTFDSAFCFACGTSAGSTLQCLMFGIFEAKIHMWNRKKHIKYILNGWTRSSTTATDTTTIECTAKVIKSHVRRCCRSLGIVQLEEVAGTRWHFYYTFFESLRFHCAQHTQTHTQDAATTSKAKKGGGGGDEARNAERALLARPLGKASYRRTHFCANKNNVQIINERKI